MKRKDPKVDPSIHIKTAVKTACECVICPSDEHWQAQRSMRPGLTTTHEEILCAYLENNSLLRVHKEPCKFIQYHPITGRTLTPVCFSKSSVSLSTKHPRAVQELLTPKTAGSVRQNPVVFKKQSRLQNLVVLSINHTNVPFIVRMAKVQIFPVRRVL